MTLAIIIIALAVCVALAVVLGGDDHRPRSALLGLLLGPVGVVVAVVLDHRAPTPTARPWSHAVDRERSDRERLTRAEYDARYGSDG